MPLFCAVRDARREEDGAAVWIAQRPGLRPRTMDLYRWLLKKHIAPYLGGVPVGKLSARLVREWRANLLANGVSVSVAAKAYRLLRAIMTTAVDEDNILARNPCRIKGAGDEAAEERPVLTVRQVFDLAERVGRRPVGNIRKVPDATGSGSTGTARCARHPSDSPPGRKPSRRCGRWPTTGAPTAHMTGGSTPCCSPPSQAFAGVRQRR